MTRQRSVGEAPTSLLINDAHDPAGSRQRCDGAISSVQRILVNPSPLRPPPGSPNSSLNDRADTGHLPHKAKVGLLTDSARIDTHQFLERAAPDSDVPPQVLESAPHVVENHR